MKSKYSKYERCDIHLGAVPRQIRRAHGAIRCTLLGCGYTVAYCGSHLDNKGIDSSCHGEAKRRVRSHYETKHPKPAPLKAGYGSLGEGTIDASHTPLPLPEPRVFDPERIARNAVLLHGKLGGEREESKVIVIDDNKGNLAMHVANILRRKDI